MDRRYFLKGSAVTALAMTTGCATPLTIPAPPKPDEFAGLDGMAQAELVRRGEASPVELVDAAIARIERLNPKLNAVVSTSFQKARDEASNGNLPDGPFKGVPYLIKDLSALEGEPLTYGSRLFAKNVAQADDADTERAKEAGFIMVGKTNTPEFGLLPTTESILLGPAANPWNLDFHTGGSSGGAAAAVAAGMVPCANAGDGGGSIRIPASICGLVGLKTSRGRLYTRMKTGLPVDLSVRMGVSRTVRDTAQLMSIGEDRSAAAPLPPAGFVEGPSRRRLKIAFYTETGVGTDAAPEVKRELENTAQLCRDLGHEVIETKPPFEGSKLEENFMALWSAIAFQIVSDARKFAATQTPPIPLEALLEPWTIGLGNFFAQNEQKAPGQLERAARYAVELEQQYAAYFDKFDLILTPVLRKPPLRLGELAPDLSFEAMYEQGLDYAAYTGNYNYVGNCAISLPTGFSSNGLPIGSQFAAKTGDERTLLELAYEVEAAVEWQKKWPQHSAVNL